MPSPARAKIAIQEETETAPERLLDPAALGSQSSQLEAFLRAHVVGQDEAVREIVTAWLKEASGLASHDRPIANLLFCGPSGVGKTLSVEVLAEAIVQNRKAVVTVDCTEFQQSHEIAKLIGSPPGYLGHRETHPQLSQVALNQYHTEKVKLSFVLFDEIEKASDALWNLLLGILDKGTLTLGDNSRVDFSRAMIFMTSNLGGSDIERMLHPRLGFAPAQAGDISGAGLEAVRKRFTPEFRNRLDRVVVFRPLSRDGIRQVLEIELARLNGRIRNEKKLGPFVYLTEEAKTRLAEDGYQPEFGARHLKRAIDRQIVQPLARLIDSGQVRHETVRVDWDVDAQAFQYFGGG